MKAELTPDYAAALHDRAERLHALIDGIAPSPFVFLSDADAALSLVQSIRAALAEVEQGLIEWRQRLEPSADAEAE